MKDSLNSDFPASFDTAECILFLGAGFSIGARTQRGEPVPGTKCLKEILLKAAELPANEDYLQQDLATIADYADHAGVNTIPLIQKHFVLSESTETQREILQYPWRRIYTTNYDNLISLCLQQNGLDSQKLTFNVLQKMPKKIPQNAVIHLHGSVLQLESEDEKNPLILSKSSYAEQLTRDSDWWELFNRDLNSSPYIFFVGYSLRDLLPQSYLIQDRNEIRSRHFILTEAVNKIEERELDSFGVRHAFGSEGFVSKLEECSFTRTKISHPNELPAFRFTMLDQDKIAPRMPTTTEIQNFLTLGKFELKLARADVGQSNYAIQRVELFKNSLAHLERGTSLFIEGKLGNGKTIFIELLKLHLTSKGFHCYTLRESTQPSNNEIAFIKHDDRAIVFISNYDHAIENEPFVKEMVNEVPVVVEVASRIFQVRKHEVTNLFGTKYANINVDHLTGTDLKLLAELMRTAGLASSANRLSTRHHSNFSAIIVEMFEEHEVVDKIRREIEGLTASPKIHDLVVALCLLRASETSAPPTFMMKALDADPVALLNGREEEAREFVNYGQNVIELRSSILAQYLLENVFETEHSLQIVRKLVLQAANRLRSSRATGSSSLSRSPRHIMSALLRFGFLKKFVGNDGKYQLIEELYEDCRRDLQIREEPLFWLQYSILHKARGDYRVAEKHLETAYSYANELTGYLTFQLDTSYFDLICLMEAAEKGRPVERMDRLIKLMPLLSKSYSDRAQREHLLRIFKENFEPFISARHEDFDFRESQSVIQWLENTIDAMTKADEYDHALVPRKEVQILKRCLVLVRGH